MELYNKAAPSSACRPCWDMHSKMGKKPDCMSCKDMQYIIYYHKHLHPLNKKVIDVWNIVHNQYLIEGMTGLPYRLDLNVVISLVNLLNLKRNKDKLWIIKGVQIMWEKILLPKIEKERKKIDADIKRAQSRRLR